MQGILYQMEETLNQDSIISWSNFWQNCSWANFNLCQPQFPQMIKEDNYRICQVGLLWWSDVHKWLSTLPETYRNTLKMLCYYYYCHSYLYTALPQYVVNFELWFFLQIMTSLCYKEMSISQYQDFTIKDTFLGR
jgi:hypothetical protein